MSVDYLDLLRSNKLASCGGLTASVVTSVQVVSKPKCFSFKTMRGSGSDIIINSGEWAKFLEFVGAKETDEPCNQD